MEVKKLNLYCDRKVGVSSKTGKPYDFYQFYTIVYGVKIYFYCTDRTGQELIKNALNGSEEDKK